VDDRVPSRRQVVEAVTDRARARERAAAARDDRARDVDEALALDPNAFDAKEVARRAAHDRDAAEHDRQAAADDRAALIGALLGAPAARDVGLRPREAEVLVRLAAGMSAREIAEDLYLSVNTVKTHTRNLYRKLGVRTRVAAANWAHENGYL
jgi:LuxR family maltose regulon positive regulatory protein